MIERITFVTSNQRKMIEARAACEPMGIAVEQLVLDFDEIQSADPLKVTRHKAESAFALAQKAIVVCDTSWDIPGLNGFPGAYMKDVVHWFEPQDWINLMRDKTDRRTSFIETIIYKDAYQIKEFSKVYWGEMAPEPLGESGNSMEKTAMFNGQTIAQRRDAGKTAFDTEEYIWAEVAEWLKTQ